MMRMLEDIAKEELKLSGRRIYQLKMAWGLFDLCLFMFIWLTLLTTNPLGPCASQLFVGLGGF
jgi:hypothetical protein